MRTHRERHQHEVDRNRLEDDLGGATLVLVLEHLAQVRHVLLLVEYAVLVGVVLLRAARHTFAVYRTLTTPCVRLRLGGVGRGQRGHAGTCMYFSRSTRAGMAASEPTFELICVMVSTAAAYSSRATNPGADRTRATASSAPAGPPASERASERATHPERRTASRRASRTTCSAGSPCRAHFYSRYRRGSRRRALATPPLSLRAPRPGAPLVARSEDRPLPQPSEGARCGRDAPRRSRSHHHE
eukprot:scaffold1023_cov292-Prasinococcus_capsulatus_cf.AAC.3